MRTSGPVCETAVSVTASTVPLRAMSLHALAVKSAARGGPGDGSELRFRDGAGGFAERIAARLGERVRLRRRVAAVHARRWRRRRRRRGRRRFCAPGRRDRGAAARARPHRRAAPLARRPLRGRRQVAAVLAADLPPDAPAAVVTDTAIGYAYRHGPRTLGSFVGSTPAAWLLRQPRALADRAVAEAVRACFGARPAAGGARALSAQLPDLRARRARAAGARGSASRTARCTTRAPRRRSCRASWRAPCAPASGRRRGHRLGLNQRASASGESHATSVRRPPRTGAQLRSTCGAPAHRRACDPAPRLEYPNSQSTSTVDVNRRCPADSLAADLNRSRACW